MTRIDGGGSGERLARVALAGTAGINGGELLNFLGHGAALRRSPGDALVHETEGNKVRVSAVIIRMQVVARGKGMRGQHGVAVVVAYLGTARLQRTATGSSGFTAEAPPSWRCTGEGGE